MAAQEGRKRRAVGGLDDTTLAVTGSVPSLSGLESHPLSFAPTRWAVQGSVQGSDEPSAGAADRQLSLTREPSDSLWALLDGPGGPDLDDLLDRVSLNPSLSDPDATALGWQASGT